MITASKTEYYKTLIETNQGNSKKLWQYLRDIIPKCAKQLSSSLIDGTKKLTDPQDIAEKFNDFFTSIVLKYIPQSQLNSDENTLDNHTLLKNFVQTKIGPDIKFSIPLIPEDTVIELLSNLDVHKTTGLDGVSAKYLKLAAPVLSRSITSILNKSITTGQFPTKWKTGRVTPIHKAGNKSECNNFRPITILCTLSKLLERHVHDAFYNFLQTHSLLYIAQSGFRALHSCETALTKIVDNWTSNMEKGLLNGVVLLDLRKAFDLVDTDVLLAKLSIYQCDNTTLNWFKSYLQGREQCVQFKGKMSESKPVTHGVPQGSILGPLLFITFMNDLPLHINSTLDMYADDSTIHVSAKTVEELEYVLNQELTNVQNWCQINRMAVNADKTKVMLITTYQKETKLPTSEINVSFNGTKLENVKSEKLLGVTIDKHLNWKDHINKTAKTVSKNIALLRRIRKYLPQQTRLTFYKAYIQSHLDYCSTIWGQSPSVTRLHILQKLALRLIMNVPKLTHSNPLFIECGVMPIQVRVKFRSATLVYKTLNGLTPSYMEGIFTNQSDVSVRTTRYSTNNKLHVPRRNLCVSRRSLRYIGSVEYNELPSDIQECNTLPSFKFKAYRHYMNSV